MMALRDRISNFKGIATATIATVATLERSKEQKQVTALPTVAKVATVAVAGTEKKGFQSSAEIVTKADEGNPWDWLRPISDRQPCYAGRDQGPSCFSCKSYDGKGSSWPGLCRYPESIGRVALEIDWSVVDPVHGCGCYEPDAKRITARDKEPDFRFNDFPFEESTGGPWCDDKPVARPISPCREKISPVALEWLREHHQALQAAGWTMRELYRRNRSKGLAWSGIWDQPLLKVYLHDNGIIEFESVIAGKDIIQTARPAPQRELNKGV
jgi:hypothetical protein